MLNAGMEIGGIRLERLLGRGAMGEVYRGVQLSLKRPVAVKRIADHLLDDDEAIQRFEREAQCVARLQSPNVVQVFDFVRAAEADGKQHCLIVMELIEGGMSLRDAQKALGALPWQQAASLAMQAAEGLAAAAEFGVIHRDVKPDNIMLSKRGVAKLADFGLARAVDSTAMTQEGALLGTPNYIAPESCRGESVDHRADLYSLGATWYHLATGQPPFKGENLMSLLRSHLEEEPRPVAELAPETPPQIATLIHACLAKDPTARPATAQALAERIQALVGEGLHVPRTVPELVAEAREIAAAAEPGEETVGATAATEVAGNAATLPSGGAADPEAATLPTGGVAPSDPNAATLPTAGGAAADPNAATLPTAVADPDATLDAVNDHDATLDAVAASDTAPTAPAHDQRATAPTAVAAPGATATATAPAGAGKPSGGLGPVVVVIVAVGLLLVVGVGATLGLGLLGGDAGETGADGAAGALAGGDDGSAGDGPRIAAVDGGAKTGSGTSGSGTDGSGTDGSGSVGASPATAVDGSSSAGAEGGGSADPGTTPTVDATPVEPDATDAPADPAPAEDPVVATTDPAPEPADPVDAPADPQPAPEPVDAPADPAPAEDPVVATADPAPEPADATDAPADPAPAEDPAVATADPAPEPADGGTPADPAPTRPSAVELLQSYRPAEDPTLAIVASIHEAIAEDDLVMAERWLRELPADHPSRPVVEQVLADHRLRGKALSRAATRAFAEERYGRAERLLAVVARHDRQLLLGDLRRAKVDLRVAEGRQLRELETLPALIEAEDWRAAVRTLEGIPGDLDHATAKVRQRRGELAARLQRAAGSVLDDLLLRAAQALDAGKERTARDLLDQAADPALAADRLDLVSRLRERL